MTEGPILHADLDAFYASVEQRDVRDRFGSAAITRATLLGRDEGPTVPLLPD